ncbi:Signal recognition particle subunit SRP72 [Caligus rogercresseyi]|uniref:Signal recognition particle subunit SRP72 n=1 Tax=Caligus rogercresseyi TaxID=217165 RepID=A0A7T8GRM5_CALRO|nr:Signal recognition particle subunit SRP72 [Caligus rogercresseyi]
MSKKESGDLVKKKKKLPMNYDPNVEPDPERWIPKRERIAFRKHLKREQRNKGEKFTGAQGDNYDYSSRKATPKSPQQKLLNPPPQDINNRRGGNNKRK